MADEVLSAGRPPFLIGTLLSTTAKVVVANFVPFVLLVTLLLSPVIAITIAASRNAFSTEPFSGWEIAAIFLALLLTQVASATLIYGVFQYLRGTPASLGKCISTGLRKMPVAILTGISYSILVSLGTILCLVPGVYLGIVYCVAVPVAVLEGKGVVDAMKRSRSLTTGHGWTLLASYLIFAFGFLLVNMSGMLLLIESPRASGLWNASFQILQSLLQATLIGVAYYQLRATEEDLDLAEIAKVFE